MDIEWSELCFSVTPQKPYDYNTVLLRVDVLHLIIVTIVNPAKTLRCP